MSGFASIFVLLALASGSARAQEACQPGITHRNASSQYNCKCWANPEDKRYLLEDVPSEQRPKTKGERGGMRPMKLTDGANNNWSFRCNYSCQDNQGTVRRFCNVVSERRTGTSGGTNDPGDSATVCAGTAIRGKSSYPQPMRVDPNRRSSESLLGSLGFKNFEYKVFPDTLVNWARQHGCL